MNEMREYYDKLELDGYINYKGVPLKCLFCGSENLLDVNMIGDGYRIEEYEVMCGSCGDITGRWAYGNWIPVF